LTGDSAVGHPVLVTDGREADPIQLGDVWSSRLEREYFITVIRPATRSGWWVVADGGNEREVAAEEIIGRFVLDTPWA
jgi:hypothetical protein